MKRKTVITWVIGFIIVHFCIGAFCFYGDAVSGNSVMTHVYEDYYGRPKNPFRIAHEILWFPLGPFSGLFWAVPFYGILNLIALAIERRRRGA